MTKINFKKEVFNRCVELYLERGKPVGSKLLRCKFFENFGDSTIRLYLNKLSKEKLLENVKNYCGRIPTDYGWRCFFVWNVDNITLDYNELKLMKNMNFFEKTRFLSSLFKVYYIIRESDGHIVEGGLENIFENEDFKEKENFMNFAVFLNKVKKYLDKLSRDYKEKSAIVYIGKELPFKSKETNFFSLIFKKTNKKFLYFLSLKRINYPYIVKLINTIFK